MGRWKVLDDVALADCAWELEGADLPDLFQTAAAAVADLMVDPQTVPTTVRRTISVEAAALDMLLYDWLSELIFRKDRDAEVYTRTAVTIAGEGPYRLTAEVEGGVLDPAHVELRADPKAVTLHQFALQRTAGGWRARVIIDI